MIQKVVDRDALAACSLQPWSAACSVASLGSKLLQQEAYDERVVEQKTERFKLKSLPTEQLSLFLICAIKKGWGEWGGSFPSSLLRPSLTFRCLITAFYCSLLTLPHLQHLSSEK